jgi:Flp pilus assembly protein TadG
MRFLRSLRAATGGAAAVEFAIIVPILATFAGGIIQYGGMIVAYNQMHDAVESGATYVMRGGTDATAVQSVTTNSWPHAPADAAVTVRQFCQCAGANAVCSALCADSSYPQSFTTISATGTYAGLWSTSSMSTVQVVRTQ